MRNVIMWIVIAAVIIILGSNMFMYQVRYDEVAIKTRFSEPVGDPISGKTDAGLKFRWFPPINRVTKYSTKVKVIEAKIEELQTTDDKSLIVLTYATWRIEPDKARQFFDSINSETEAAELLGDRLDDIRKVISTYSFDQLVNTDQSKLKLEECEAKMRHLIQYDTIDNLLAEELIALIEAHQAAVSKGDEARATAVRNEIRDFNSDFIGRYSVDVSSAADLGAQKDKLSGMLASGAFIDDRGVLDQYGIRVEQVGIRKIALPTSVTDKVFTAMIKTRERKAENAKAAGTAEATMITNSAEADRATIMTFAESRADAIRAKGDQEAADKLAAFRDNPESQEFAIFLRKIETLKATLAQKTTFILSADSMLDLFTPDPTLAGAVSTNEGAKK